ncbi:S41 family peptidase [Parapedobacter indicus]|uniref:C-terminal processing protease CtpA/Prc, contains a PDZ domain n=1 Tax=Parapedobacter indicus TaxID=1477437 RepID=A0A1I3Q4I4_9SPHI|nr:S41 family peptidase [Parapedobacter indicus]PPL00668.1 C-terminal processing protease CtpA/Prc [Parapedobacter indicus]SFJ28599.1 C-terminal processing protease CtpA/Prc, contains a PDZ domain [Parapedobacter indicus]
MHTILFNRITVSHAVWMVAAVLLLVTACKKENGGNVQPSQNEKTNQWVIENMRDVYYWNTSIPQDRNLDFDLGPEEFFDKILHPDDRFSWIQLAKDLEDDLSGVSTTVGLGIGLLQINQAGEVIISVRYALEGSPADEAGIERGDIITEINGRALTVENYQEVLEPYYGSATFRVQLAHINENDQIVVDQEIELTPVERFQEQAIHLDTVITTAGGKKVGYLFYNRFLNEQPNELLDAFFKFKTAGVSDLILDLRYNGGGGIWIAAIMSGLIQANFRENDPFIEYKYNSNYDDETLTYYQLFGGDSDDEEEVESADEVVSAINELNLNLPRVYILATNYSASASELVINNLRPFLSDANVIHIGETTVGKNEGSITIIDEREPPEIEWGIQPIIVKLANKNGFGDYPNGLDPQYEVDEWDYLPWAPIGSLDDPLLAKALGLIDPRMQPIAAKTMGVKAQTARKLHAVKVAGFEDELNRPVPVDIGRPKKPFIR